MAALIERSDQLISLTALTRHGSGHFDSLIAGINNRFVVMSRAEPVAVVLNIHSFESMLDEIEQLRTEVLGLGRMGKLADAALSHKELQQRLGF